MQAVILQRLAQLSPIARHIAEIGAVYGQPFSLNLLLQTGQEEDILVSALDELWQKGMIAEKTANTYEYTHDKLREVAYNELSAPQRRSLHLRVAKALENLYGSNLEQVNGQIAVHYDRAGVPEKAISFYTVAGSTAASVYANEDAITLLKRGLDLIQQVDHNTKQNHQELDLLLAIIPPYRFTKGWTAPELGQALNRALALCDQVGTPAQRAQILYGLQSVYVVEGRLEKVQNTYDEMRYLFLQTQGSLPQFAGLMHTGARLHRGQFLEARKAFEEIMASHDEEQIRDLQASQGVNYLAHAHAWNAHALWFLGFSESAQQCALSGVQISARYAQPFNQALTATYLAMLQELRADSNGFRAQAEEALILAQESRAPYYQHWAQILVCFADSCDQPTANHLSCLEDAIQAFMATGARLRLPYYMSLLARAYHQFGETEKGLNVIEQAMSAALKNQERCWDSKLHRLRGEFLFFQTPKRAETLSIAESALLQSLDIAKAQKTITFELRASVSLARLWKEQQRPLEGKRLLTPILERFTEGCNSSDIQSAQSFVEIPD
jgi:predicted ATPase